LSHEELQRELEGIEPSNYKNVYEWDTLAFIELFVIILSYKRKRQ
jgi:hypothetical protein